MTVFWLGAAPRLCWEAAAGGKGDAATDSVLSPLSAASAGVGGLIVPTGEGGAEATTLVASAAGLLATIAGADTAGAARLGTVDCTDDTAGVTGNTAGVAVATAVAGLVDAAGVGVDAV